MVKPISFIRGIPPPMELAEMAAGSYVVIPNINCPRWVPLTGWRKWLAAMWLYPRTAAVFTSKDGSLFCHPDTVDSLTRYLRANNHAFTIGMAAPGKLGLVK